MVKPFITSVSIFSWQPESALLFVSCVQKTGPEGVLGNYSVTCDKTVSAYTGPGNSERR